MAVPSKDEIEELLAEANGARWSDLMEGGHSGEPHRAIASKQFWRRVAFAALAHIRLAAVP